MIAGVPWQTWLLLVLSFGIGLVITLRSWWRGHALDRRAAEVSPDERDEA